MDEVCHLILPIRAEPHVHGVGVTEQIVQIAENLLIRAGEEDAQDVRFAVRETVELQAGPPVLVTHEAIDLAVGIAGDVLQRPATGRFLDQSMNGHDREQLIDRPTVRQRLEDGEVAEVAIDERRVEVHDDVLVLVAILLHGAGDGVDRGEVDLFRHGASTKRQHTGIEQLVRALLVEREVVIDLPNAALGDILPRGVTVIRHHFVQ